MGDALVPPFWGFINEFAGLTGYALLIVDYMGAVKNVVNKRFAG